MIYLFRFFNIHDCFSYPVVFFLFFFEFPYKIEVCSWNICGKLCCDLDVNCAESVDLFLGKIAIFCILLLLFYCFRSFCPLLSSSICLHQYHVVFIIPKLFLFGLGLVCRARNRLSQDLFMSWILNCECTILDTIAKEAYLYFTVDVSVNHELLHSFWHHGQWTSTRLQATIGTWTSA